MGGIACEDLEGVGSDKAGDILFHWVHHKVGSEVGLWVLSCLIGR